VLAVLAVPVLVLLTTLASASFSGLTLASPSGLTLPFPPRRIPFRGVLGARCRARRTGRGGNGEQDPGECDARPLKPILK
jgi:hypothetical protein